MTIEMNKKDAALNVKLCGGLDTLTAPELEAALNDAIFGAEELIFDFEELEYISSAGLRIILQAQKIMDESGGSMKVVRVNEEITEVFEITGFIDILTIE